MTLELLIGIYMSEYRSQHQVVPSQVTTPAIVISTSSIGTLVSEPDPIEQPTCISPQPRDLEQIVHVPNERIQTYVLKKVKLKLDHGHSISVTEDHLRNTADMIGGNELPTKWSEVLSLMKTLGYRDPKH